MTIEPAAHPFPPDEEALATALAELCQLSPAILRKIREAMTTSGLSFSDACLNLGYATPEQIAEAIASVHQATASSKGTSLIQLAMKRASGNIRHVSGPETQATTAPSKRLTIAFDAYSRHGESIRTLRTELLLRKTSSNLATTLSVVSPGEKEGRTQIAAELAISFAQAGKRVLLADCDFRNPGLHSLFLCDQSSGLSDAISNPLSKPFLYAVEGCPSLCLITSGTTSNNPLELLSQPAFKTLIAGWERYFEFIILDTPPASQFSDAIAISDIAGNVLLISRAHQSSLSDCKETIRKLGSTQANIIGAVINHF